MITFIEFGYQVFSFILMLKWESFQEIKYLISSWIVINLLSDLRLLIHLVFYYKLEESIVQISLLYS